MLVLTERMMNNMKGIKVGRAVLVLTVSLSLGVQMPAYAGQWNHDGVGYWYREDDGSYPRSQWKLLDHYWYYFDENGYIVTGWYKSGGNWYYLEKRNGNMLMNWQYIDGCWYFFHDDGRMAANEWVGDYYFTDSGALAEVYESENTSNNAVYEGTCYGQLEKRNGVYWYSGNLVGYDESRIPSNGHWTEGYYDVTYGNFYVDGLTKVVVDSYYAHTYPAKGKTAEEWLDDFYSRREYWMVLALKVEGSHIEEIRGIYSFD